MQNSIMLSVAVGTLARESPLASRIFERMEIDYCCGRKQSLEDACWRRNLNPRIVADELQAALSEPTNSSDENFASLSQTEMCDTIVATHHEFMKSALPRLTTLPAKVRQVHGGKYHWILKENNILFPLAAQMADSLRNKP